MTFNLETLNTMWIASEVVADPTGAMLYIIIQVIAVLIGR